MKHLLIVSLAVFLILSCNEKQKETAQYTDLFLFNMKGDISSVQDSIYSIDSTGKMLPDSICYELGEYKGGYLSQYTTSDSSGNKSYTYYQHYDNGLWKAFRTVANGKTIDSGFIQLDSSGKKYFSAETFDSTGKKTIYRDLNQNEYGRLTSGKTYHSDNTLQSSFIDMYDGHLYTGSTNFDSLGKETSKTKLKLNDKGDAVEETTITTGRDSTTTVEKKYRYDNYDQTGNWTQQTELDKNGKPLKVTVRKIMYTKGKF